MRWGSRRDGTIAVYDDVYPNDDLLVVEPIVTTFTPTHGNGRCICGRFRLDARTNRNGVFSFERNGCEFP